MSMLQELGKHYSDGRKRLNSGPPKPVNTSKFVQPRANDAELLTRIEALEKANKQLCHVLQIHNSRLSKTESETELLIEQIRRRNLTGKVIVIRDRPKVSEVQEITAKFFGITMPELCGDARVGPIVYARQIAMHLCLTMTGRSTTFIGNEFGGRGMFQHEARSTGFYRPACVSHFLVHGQEHDLHARVVPLQCRERIKSIEVRHGDVSHNDIRSQLLCGFD